MNIASKPRTPSTLLNIPQRQAAHLRAGRVDDAVKLAKVQQDLKLEDVVDLSQLETNSANKGTFLQKYGHFLRDGLLLAGTVAVGVHGMFTLQANPDLTLQMLNLYSAVGLAGCLGYFAIGHLQSKANERSYAQQNSIDSLQTEAKRSTTQNTRAFEKSELTDELSHMEQVASVQGDKAKAGALAQARRTLGEDDGGLSDALIDLKREDKPVLAKALKEVSWEFYQERPMVREQRQRVELLEAALERLNSDFDISSPDLKPTLQKRQTRATEDLEQARQELEKAHSSYRVAEDLLTIDRVSRSVQQILQNAPNPSSPLARSVQTNIELARRFLDSSGTSDELKTFIKRAESLGQDLPALLQTYLQHPKPTALEMGFFAPDKERQASQRVRESKIRLEKLEVQKSELSTAWNARPVDQRNTFVKDHLDQLSATIKNEQAVLAEAEQMERDFRVLQGVANIDRVLS